MTQQYTSQGNSKENEVRVLKRHLYSHVYCSIISNSQDTETNYMLVNDAWVKKILYVRTHIPHDSAMYTE